CIAGTRAASNDEMLVIAIQTGMDSCLIGLGDTVVISAGVPVGETGTTNLMKIHVVGEEVAKRQEIGRKAAKGKIVAAKTPAEAVA
ncbi:pyruvate kinase alpha/beta domain-containing protein, partial [Bacillus sp. BML-BC060]|uniref:pyruvate kinase alpha/beta domain-containing protein n=1 Tax=Bacillus sp. BML-BC060 TaxID=2842487 RepID=UPI00283AB08C